MQASQARPSFSAWIRCSGVEKSPGSRLRLLTMMSGWSSKTISVHLLRFPAGGVERPGDVVPEDVDLAVVGEQFADLAVDVIDEAAAGGFVGRAARAVGVVPVHQRVVEARRAGPRRGRPRRTPSPGRARPPAWARSSPCSLRVEQAEAFVVLGGHDHVFLPGLPGELGPRAGGVRRGR